jgi:hypothetical protein
MFANWMCPYQKIILNPVIFLIVTFIIQHNSTFTHHRDFSASGLHHRISLHSYHHPTSLPNFAYPLIYPILKARKTVFLGFRELPGKATNWSESMVSLRPLIGYFKIFSVSSATAYRLNCPYRQALFHTLWTQIVLIEQWLCQLR